MATVTGSESLAVADWDHGSESKSDRYLAARLAAASADYKGVAMATFALAVAVTAVAWLVLGVLAEHWLVPGGLPVPARWLWLCLGLAALAAAVVRWVVPLLRYRVNLVYAARVIEHDHPELHNDLVNAVLVKAHPDGASPRVARMLERRAAKRLTGVPADGIADRGLALKLTSALAVLVAACCIYQLVAPKSLVRSAARLVAPWWELAAPARVSIAEPRLAWRMPPDDAGGERPVHPVQVSRGAASLIRGRQLLVETDVTGLRGDERPTLEVTPIRDDGTVDTVAAWRVSLAAAGRSAAMATVLPDAVRGLQHGVELVVTAGDARSDRIRVAVVDTPTLLVREVRYEFPAYTGKPPETVPWQGDLRAPEFTKVTLTAESNRPLDVAWVDPECAGRESERKRLRIGQHDLSRAIGEFPLRMNADRTGPEFTSYRLGFRPRSAAGAPETEIVEKLEQRVEVIPDLPPEVTIEAPGDAIRVPPSAPVAIRVRAVDPDYGVARVFVEARVDGAPVRPEAKLLEKPHPGVFNGTVEIVPERLGAIAGRKLEYRAVVEDTRPERPNRTESPWRTLQIDASARPQPPARQPGADGDRGGQGEPQQGDREAADAGASSDRRDSGEQSSKEGQLGGQNAGEQASKQEGSQDGQRGGQEGSEQGGQQGGQQGGEGRAQAKGGGGQRDGAAPAGKQAAEAQGSRGDAKPDGRSEPPSPRAVAADGTDDGEAMERILESKRRSEAGQPGDKANADRGAARPEPKDAAERQRATEPKSCQGADGKPCGKQGCESCGGGGASGGASGQASKSQGSGKPGEGQAGDSQADAGESGTGRPGAGTAGLQKPGAGQEGGDARGPGQSGAGQAGAGRASGDQSGQGQVAQGKPEKGKSAEGTAGESSAGEGTGEEGQPGAGQVGDGKPGQGQSDSGQAADGRPGPGRPGSGTPGEGQADAGRMGEDQGSQRESSDNPSGEGRSEDGMASRDKPGADQTAKGTPGAGQSATGKPGAGKPGAGQSAGAASGRGTDGEPPETSDVASGSEMGGGGRMGGDRGQTPSGSGAGQAPNRDVEWTQQETAHARNAADLAIEHLRDSVNQGRTDVLDELGWTPEQARAFIERWQRMRSLAESGDPVQRGEFERAVRSLGLRPDGVRSGRDVPADRKGGQAEGRRSRPPAAYREQVEAYLRGTGGG